MPHKDTEIACPSAAELTTCELCSVRNAAVCSSLSDPAHKRLQSILRHRRFEEGETLFYEGDPCRYVYSITNGVIRLLKALPDGRRYIAGFLLPGDFIGLTEETIHSLTAETVTDCELCVFVKEELDEFIKSNREVQDRLFSMARHALLSAYENQLVLGRFSPIERVARFILDMNERINGKNSKTAVVLLPMNRTDVADYLGLTIETVSRSFSKLKAQGLIQLSSSSSVEILNRSELARIAAKV